MIGDSVSNHQPHHCLPNRLFKAQIKENIKAPRHWPLWGEFTRDGEFPAQRASNAENVSIWWRHHEHGFFSLQSRPQTWDTFTNVSLSETDNDMDMYLQTTVFSGKY